ncbi:MAG: hypothetical protein OQL08_02260 [Gammaproteobacteria bacterium]|nr:hypothetical protein [Gammaproteobacteria bacterium]
MTARRLKLLAVVALALLFLVVYSQVGGPQAEPPGEPRAESPWQLEPLQTPKPDPNRVTRLNKRLGWAATPGGVTQAPVDTSQSRVLGIQRDPAGERWIIAGQAGSMARYTVGDTLPDGREVIAIEGDVIRFAFEGQQSEQRLFAYTRPQAPSPE